MRAGRERNAPPPASLLAIVRKQLDGIGAFRFVAFASPSEVERDAGEVLRIFGDLKGVTGVIGGQVGNEYEWIAGSLLVIVHGDVVGFDLRHTSLL